MYFLYRRGGCDLLLKEGMQYVALSTKNCVVNAHFPGIKVLIARSSSKQKSWRNQNSCFKTGVDVEGRSITLSFTSISPTWRHEKLCWDWALEPANMSREVAHGLFRKILGITRSWNDETQNFFNMICSVKWLCTPLFSLYLHPGRDRIWTWSIPERKLKWLERKQKYQMILVDGVCLQRKLIWYSRSPFLNHLLVTFP